MIRACTRPRAAREPGRRITAEVRVGIVSDTHGVLDARIAELLVGCDVLVHGGDVGAGSVLSALRCISRRLFAVRGNNDTAGRWPAGEQALPASLPVVARVMLPGGELVVEHGDAYPARARHARLRAAHPQARAVVYGHSHRLLIDREQEPWLLNPGAAGRARTFAGPSCLVLLASGDEWRVSEHRFELVPARPRRPAVPHRGTR